MEFYCRKGIHYEFTFTIYSSFICAEHGLRIGIHSANYQVLQTEKLI